MTTYTKPKNKNITPSKLKSSVDPWTIEKNLSFVPSKQNLANQSK